ncbi:putative pyrroline-5-carboxylate reductase protein [Neofusicoccum parvum]|uniref:Pyrroline-5-carboxylate reductase protein n=1 Tax=Neofusicoccum parvum TaxID=310453 RepID=A0ACB5SEW5_9PEZI|nr:putative pyrroline-5-carboxylate reductase protein [Neofusicoccum parvum]GME61408.1 putative pyrroline-5-carboxylate reductase protein [Neofusicoccum parvum]
MAQAQQDNGLTLTVLGCGVMGNAILGGVMAALDDPSGPSTADEQVPPRLPTKFVACDAWEGAPDAIRSVLGKYNKPLEIFVNDNLAGAKAADVVLLACKPYMLAEVLGAPGMREALDGKLIMSILAGVSVEQIEQTLYPDGLPKQNPCRVVRVMPNTAALVRQSMTVISQPTPPLSKDQTALVTWIFNRVGKVVQLPPHLMDASTALCGSGPAFVALILEGLADGAVAMGIPRKEAQLMAAQMMKGTTGLVLEENRHPSILKDMVSTPGGCTIGGLLTLEEGAVRGQVARAVREATVVASQLGQGVKNVNGTRH